MENSRNNIDINALPVHLFVKSQKQAKKLLKPEITRYSDLPSYGKSKRFKSSFIH